eukprot:GFYU01009319.1.p1 GENE.GFYU01009319.1~~GFYU01009319.1.p1  ORF type:complete len:159 (-),score=74.14 GFYU01009319.1:56-532(-)
MVKHRDPPAEGEEAEAPPAAAATEDDGTPKRPDPAPKMTVKKTGGVFPRLLTEDEKKEAEEKRQRDLEKLAAHIEETKQKEEADKESRQQQIVTMTEEFHQWRTDLRTTREGEMQEREEWLAKRQAELDEWEELASAAEGGGTDKKKKKEKPPAKKKK